MFTLQLLLTITFAYLYFVTVLIHLIVTFEI